MSAQNIEKAPLVESSKQEKVASLFRFIEELSKLRLKASLNVADYPWVCNVNSVHSDVENININYQDLVDDESGNASNVLFSVRKPQSHPCPSPDPTLVAWLDNDWNDYHQEVKVKDYIACHDSRDESLNGN